MSQTTEPALLSTSTKSSATQTNWKEIFNNSFEDGHAAASVSLAAEGFSHIAITSSIVGRFDSCALLRVGLDESLQPGVRRLFVWHNHL